MAAPQGFAFTTRSPALRRILQSSVVVEAHLPPLPEAGAAKPLAHQFIAIWDTGASGSVITQAVVDALKLKPIGMTQVSHANGTSLAEIYTVNFILPNRVKFPALNVTKGVISDQHGVLIGMDIIGAGDFAVTNFQNKTTFTYRVPSFMEIDFVPGMDARNGQTEPYVPCPCGSGKKYKFCCSPAAQA